jgi:hypothetical protein
MTPARVKNALGAPQLAFPAQPLPSQSRPAYPSIQNLWGQISGMLVLSRTYRRLEMRMRVHIWKFGCRVVRSKTSVCLFNNCFPLCFYFYLTVSSLCKLYIHIGYGIFYPVSVAAGSLDTGIQYLLVFPSSDPNTAST